MISDRVTGICVLFFVACFFAYLFGPLIVMSLTAFNSSAFPRVTPWECFTVEWFNVLVQDAKLMEGLRNSLVIGLGVVCLAVPIGLAGALMLTQLPARARPWYYTIVISPILVPGVVLGISTLIFWDRISIMFGATAESLFYDVSHNGIFLTILGQSTFISAYAMLVFIARLQRFDPGLEEAALDLGATHLQAFRKVLLPFLRPAVASAAVLAFLASFENYNTTVFTIVSESTLTTVLASKVRYGINPSISALAVVIVLVTLFGAAMFEIVRRREARAATGQVASRRRLALEPALYLVIAIFVAGLGTAFFAGTMGVEECKVAVKEEKRRVTEERIRKLRESQRAQDAAVETPTTPKVKAPGTEGYQNIFSPGNLRDQSGAESKSDTAPKRDTDEEKVKSPGATQYQNIFAPQNLRQDGDASSQGDAPPESRGKSQ
ncbi:MAG: ABC transporter permease [Pseudomonadota bacterium]